MNLPDLTDLIEPLARKLFGEPDPRFSRGSELRFGPHAMFMIDVKRGCWFDYDRGRGGDVYALLKERFGCGLEWVEREQAAGNDVKVDGGGQGGAAEEQQEQKNAQGNGSGQASGETAGQETSATTGQTSGKTGKRQKGSSAQTGEVTLDDFVAYLPEHKYFFIPTRQPWAIAGVNARLKPIPLVDVDGKPLLDDKGKPKFISASTWLDQHRRVEQITWLPGEPMLIKDMLITDDGPIKRAGVTTFNLYRAPTLIHRRGDIAPWRDHLHRIYPNEADHIEKWLAHRVQRPRQKINHALVLGGEQGIGKDSMLEPARRAVGRSNVHEVTPRHILGRFNGYIKSVILRVNEGRDLGEYDRFAFYDHMKGIIATPPDVLRVDEKHLREYNVINCVAVVITTNHKTDGIYLASDDRRHLVGWSECRKVDFDPEYWNRLWHYFDHGGDAHVAAYLAELDLAKFNPMAEPPKTEAFWAIVNANRAPEEGELADILDKLGMPDSDNPEKTILPDVVTLQQLQNNASGEFEDWLKDLKNRRQIPHRMERCGYVPVRNPDAEDTLWRIAGKRQVVYARAKLTLSEQYAAVRKLGGIKQPADKAPPRASNGKATIEIIEPDPDHPCAQCGGSPDNGDVYRIRGPEGVEASLHQQCAPFFFKLR